MVVEMVQNQSLVDCFPGVTNVYVPTWELGLELFDHEFLIGGQFVAIDIHPGTGYRELAQMVS